MGVVTQFWIANSVNCELPEKSAWYKLFFSSCRGLRGQPNCICIRKTWFCCILWDGDAFFNQCKIVHNFLCGLRYLGKRVGMGRRGCYWVEPINFSCQEDVKVAKKSHWWSWQHSELHVILVGSWLRKRKEDDIGKISEVVFLFLLFHSYWQWEDSGWRTQKLHGVVYYCSLCRFKKWQETFIQELRKELWKWFIILSFPKTFLKQQKELNAALWYQCIRSKITRWRHFLWGKKRGKSM